MRAGSLASTHAHAHTYAHAYEHTLFHASTLHAIQCIPRAHKHKMHTTTRTLKSINTQSKHKHTAALLHARAPARSLEFIHLPFAEGGVAPRIDPAFYAPLGRLWVPSHTHIIAGKHCPTRTRRRLPFFRSPPFNSY